MNFLFQRVLAVGLFLSIAVPMQAFGQSANSNTNNTAIKNVGTNVNAARTQVAQAEQAFNQAQAQFNEAQSKNRFQMRHVQTVRAKVFEEHDKSSALEEGRKEVEKLEKEFNELKRPVLDHVRAQSEYRIIAKKYEAAEKAVKDDGDDSLTDAQRNRMLQEVMSMQTEMRQMEKAAVLENTEAKAAYANLQAARARVKELCQQRDQEIDSDSNLSGAYSELKSSKQEFDQTKVRLAAESDRLAMAQQQLANAVAAQAAAQRNTRRRN